MQHIETDSGITESDIRSLCQHPVVVQVLNSVRGGVVVLDSDRRIVALNELFSDLCGRGNLVERLGLRPGDAFGCRHAFGAPDGCGSGQACGNCDLLRLVRESMTTGALSSRECTVTTERDGGRFETIAVDAHAAPIEISGSSYTVVTLLDIGKLKRRETLQRIFFHDILNSLAGLTGICDLMESGPQDVASALVGEMRSTADYLLEAVHSQRDLLAMEDNQFAPNETQVRVSALFEKVNRLVYMSGLLHSREVFFDLMDDTATVCTDGTLLVRVLVNMVKNGLEAVSEGGTVFVRFFRHSRTVRFEVENVGVIPTDIAQRIFEKHFSSKGGVGRGIGTFGMKLIGETYLGGRVGFESSQSTTTFFIELPQNDSAAPL